MKNIGLLVLETLVSASLIWLGLSGKHFLWIASERAAAITLSCVGFMLCMASIGKFISAAPAHPLTILGYVLGVILLASMIAQIFGIKLPFVGNPRNALVTIGVCIVLKGIIAQFQGFLVK